jgi:DnaJ-class molecular chaperone
MTPATTAILNGIKWYFHDCPNCAGSGTSYREHNSKRLPVDCRTCEGRGYIKTTQINENPTRDGTKRKTDCHSEKEVFDLAGVQFLPPPQRL